MEQKLIIESILRIIKALLLISVSLNNVYYSLYSVRLEQCLIQATLPTSNISILKQLPVITNNEAIDI
ncbi:hypothetical protein QPL65_25625, partial [Escherichia coli]|uniref:hypothetical protein n=1 Tax=Escherichia coli TaxID=562 RepID=UPI0026F8BDD4